MSSHEEGLVERLRTTKRELLADPEVDALFEEAASKIEQLERTYAHEQRLSYSLTKENNRLTERVKELEEAEAHANAVADRLAVTISDVKARARNEALVEAAEKVRSFKSPSATLSTTQNTMNRVYNEIADAIDALKSHAGEGDAKDRPHPSHAVRGSDASAFDAICDKCGATDQVPGGWGKLADPCPNAGEGAGPVHAHKGPPPMTGTRKGEGDDGPIIRRGRIIGTLVGPAVQEADHFIRCEYCGGLIDCRDLGQVLKHEGSGPCPTEDAPQ